MKMAATTPTSVPQIFLEPDSPAEGPKRELKTDDGNLFAAPKLPPPVSGFGLGRKLPGGVMHGRSMTNWMRKVSSDGRRPVCPNRVISLAELKKHNKRNDVWMAIRGRVYDVTDYVDYHPGGATYLMKGAGMDATIMFNAFHNYVNLESILKNRQVGIYVPEVDQTDSKGKPNKANSRVQTSFQQTNELAKYQVKYPGGANMDLSRWTVSLQDKQDLTVRLLISPEQLWLSQLKLLERLNENVVKLNFDDDFRQLTLTLQKPTPSKTDAGKAVEVEPYSGPASEGRFLDVTVEGSTRMCKVSNRNGGITTAVFKISRKHYPLIFAMYEQRSDEHQIRKTWESLGTAGPKDDVIVDINEEQGVFYNAAIVVKVPVCENHYLFGIALDAGVHLGIPVLWHVSLKVKGIEKPYTPIPLLTDEQVNKYSPAQASSNIEHQIIYFYVKIYKEGRLTPVLDAVKEQALDEIQVGDLAGFFDPEFLVNTDRLLLFGGGTGITPFVGLIKFLQKNRNSYSVEQVVLVHSVSNEDELLWPEEFRSIVKSGDWFYYLPQVTRSNNGLNNRLSTSIVSTFLSSLPKFKNLFINEPLYTVKALSCGPTGFLTTCESICDSLNIASDNRIVLS